MDFCQIHTVGGQNYFVVEDGFIDYIRELGYESIDVNDLFTEFMDWLEDEAA